MEPAQPALRLDADDEAVQSDAYIDALLNGHARLPITLSRAPSTPEHNVRQVIRLLETGLPRFHPSFLFEERLAEQLRAAGGAPGDSMVALDRRLLMGGAIASGVSIGAAAMFAWRRRQG
ncbi:MAG TPA: hypothetical protein VH542_09185 [Steroidobacteraceae bacterium]|jgi:hypothetical protein